MPGSKKNSPIRCKLHSAENQRNLKSREVRLLDRAFHPSEVTPEMAIHVVRNFILPMFETEGKKILRNKAKNSKDPNKDLGLGG